MPDLQTWSNQEPENKNLEQLSILFEAAISKINELEARLALLE